MSRFGVALVVGWAAALWLAVGVPLGPAAQLVLKDGRVLRGKLAPTPSLGQVLRGPTSEDSTQLKLIWFVDDNLRRTFVSKRQIQRVIPDDGGEVLERFRIRQRARRGGPAVVSIRAILYTDPFDEYGRRYFTMLTGKGAVNVVEGITELTPVWAKVEGITHVRDMRMATSSIPLKTLDKILRRQIDPRNPEHRVKIARFYLQGGWYEQAKAELESILEDFPNDAELQEQLTPEIRRIAQMDARRKLRELELRADAGQHMLVRQLLAKFPSEGVAGEILQAVREMARQYQEYDAQGKKILERIDQLVAAIEDPAVREEVAPVRDEIFSQLGINTLERMAAFRQLADDPSLMAEEKLALAISGWLVGSNTATPKLPVALSLYRVRHLVRQYLTAGEPISRAEILEKMRSEEGAVPSLVAQLVAHMMPPQETPPQEKPGYYELEVPGLGPAPPVRYVVQLPPEYDPYRRYPTILTLHGAGTTPELQVDWWAGAWQDSGVRLGQASRHGYIVIAPRWAEKHQTEFRYSAREHAAVLDCLRDACRRFAIDTDRVFLSGHSMGGNAAWDLALAHPDLWAGVIPIVATADKYCTFYWRNAKLVPYYFVCGELDGNAMAENASQFDRYLRLGYNVTVVQYIGRGHEHFSDEILRLFDWMNRFRRDFWPREFLAVSMRPWDNFFWWVELSSFPPRTMVDPIDWPPPAGRRPVKTEAKLTVSGGMQVSTGAGQATVWLAPDIVDFGQPVSIVVNGRRANAGRAIEPDLETLLEDVRTRADRQHPFWAKITTTTGRGVVPRSAARR
ncbi:MAG TPA: peptidase [Planctomycetes bacterium]|nr:peptidase [Planctomycetota bacterium]